MELQYGCHLSRKQMFSTFGLLSQWRTRLPVCLGFKTKGTGTLGLILVSLQFWFLINLCHLFVGLIMSMCNENRLDMKKKYIIILVENKNMHKYCKSVWEDQLSDVDHFYYFLTFPDDLHVYKLSQSETWRYHNMLRRK